MRSTGWSDVPQDILHDAIRHLLSDLRSTEPAKGGADDWRQCYNTLHCLSLVCTLWRAAVRDFPSHLKCNGQSLREVCRRFPSLQGLAITMAKHCELMPLASYTRLSDLSIITSNNQPLAVLDVSCLPSTVTRFKYQADGSTAMVCFKGNKLLPISHFQGGYSSRPLGYQSPFMA